MRALFAVAVLSLLTVAAEERVTARLEWEPGFLGRITYREYELGKEPAEGVVVPEKLQDPRFGALRLADDIVLHVAYEAAGARNALWVDTDLDGDLAEESPRIWARYRNYLRAADTVSMRLPGEEQPLPVHFYFSRRGPEHHDRIGLVSRIHRRGRVVLSGRLRLVALIDGNGDLRFDSEEHDRVHLDLDGDGDLGGSSGPHEILRIGEPFALGGKGHRAVVRDPLGGAIEFVSGRKKPDPRLFLGRRDPTPPERRIEAPPERPFEEVAAALAAATPQERRTLLAEVARFGSKQAFQLLMRTAREDKSPTLRAEAVRQTGYEAYRKHAAEISALALDEQAALELRLAAVESLHAMGAPGRAKVFATILERAREKDHRDFVQAVARHLARVGTKKARRLLADALSGQSVYVLRLRTYRGGSEGDPDGPSRALIDAGLADRSDIIRSKALWDLWRLRDPRAREVAAEVLTIKEDQMFGLVGNAIRILAWDTDPGAIRVLLPWAQRGSNDVWRLLFRTLGPVRDPDSMRAIAAGLGDEGVRVRALCADLLGGMRDPSIVTALGKALAREKDTDIAQRIARSLGDQGDPRAAKIFLKLARKKGHPARPDVLAALARVGAGDPKVAAFFRGLLRSARWTERILALDVAAGGGSANLLSEVLANLDHDAWQVRLATVQALRALRVREGVEPLIDRLEKEQVRRLRAEIGETLFRLTGQDLFDLTDAWRRWWSDHGSSFEVPAELPRRGGGKGHTVAGFYGLPVRSDRVCFVLDRSGSMDAVDTRSGKEKRTRLQTAATEVRNAVRRLSADARINVVFFASEIDSWRKSLTQLTTANRPALGKHLEKQEPEGDTNLWGGLEAALRDDAVDTVFLLSDGAPNVGRYRETGSILRAVRRSNQTRRIAIHCVAIGRDSDLLRRLAAENGGSYARR